METAFDIISLVLFIVVILLAFFRKVNVGVVAVTFGVIMVRIFGLTDKDLIGGFSTSMFTTLVGITLLFAAITQTGALDLLARKIIALAGNKMWVLPIMVYIAGFVIAGVGPGAVPALAIIPALAAIIAVEVGFNPLMLVLIGEQGLMAGRMTPITPEAAIITGAAAEANIANVMPTILVCQTLVTIVSSLVFWFIFKGHKVKQPLNPIERGTLEKFNAKQIISLLSILLMLVLLIFVKVNIGVAAFAVAGLLFLFGVADDGKALKSLPWGTIVMVLAVGSLLNIVNKMGGIDLMSNALAKIMTKGTATPFMGISAALLSLVSSALGVVYPTMMPMCADICPGRRREPGRTDGGCRRRRLSVRHLPAVHRRRAGYGGARDCASQPHQGGREQDVRAAVHLRRPCDPDPDRALLDHLRPAGKPAAWRLIPGNV